MNKIIDLRSDTVTQPSEAMREAMRRADVGDDVYGEDPTVNRLQEKCARLTGKEDALFVASGTMGNLVALLSHCGRGDEVILGAGCHISQHEQGGIAALGGIHPRAVANNPDGTLDLDAVEAAIMPDDVHCARTRLLCLENTWNGRVLRPEYMERAGALAKRHGLSVHLDGARIFNAAVCLDEPVSRLAEHADSIQFCFSKGLAAPVGSILCGSKDFIRQARRMRKVLGGGMRQAGVLAAACLTALDTMVERLADDHANARRLSSALCELPGIVLVPEAVETNIVFFRSEHDGFDAPAFAARLADRGVLVLDMDSRTIRAVTHYGIEPDDIERAIQSVRDTLAAGAFNRGSRSRGTAGM